MTVHAVIVAAIVVPILSLGALTAAKRIGRWLGAAMRESMVDTVKGTVKPDLDVLAAKVDGVGRSLDTLRDENARDHERVRQRLEALEERVARMESRLSQPITTEVHTVTADAVVDTTVRSEQ